MMIFFYVMGLSEFIDKCIKVSFFFGFFIIVMSVINKLVDDGIYVFDIVNNVVLYLILIIG